MAVALHHLALLVALRVADHQLEQEAIQLRFRQRVGALLFHRILRGDHQETGAQRMVGAVDGDHPLLHRLQQRRLRLRRGAVDLVGEKNLREDGAFGEGEAVVREIEQVGAQHIARHQVRRELDAAEVKRQAGGEAAGEHGLGGARHAFDERMAFAEQTHQQQIQGGVLPHHGLVDFRLDGGGEVGGVFRRHRTSPAPSVDNCAPAPAAAARASWPATAPERRAVRQQR